jgi:menaquinone-dependent protoporphyrinogen IX oxidase
MKTIIMYYTLGGTSRKEAERIAEQNKEAILCEVKEEKKRNIITAFVPGCSLAMKREKSKIKVLAFNLEDFDSIILVAPIWAGFPVPAFNAMVNLLPKEKEVEVHLCSSGGETPKSEEGTKQMIKDKGCKLTGYHDIKVSK